MTENEIATIIVDLCYKIHAQYGPGMFESIYEGILAIELEKRKIPFKRQSGIRVFHEGVDLGIGFVPDMIIEDKVVIELKSVESINEVHHKQLLSYLKIMNLKLGLLVNFNVSYFKNGIFRKVNNL